MYDINKLIFASQISELHINREQFSEQIWKCILDPMQKVSSVLSYIGAKYWNRDVHTMKVGRHTMYKTNSFLEPFAVHTFHRRDRFAFLLEAGILEGTKDFAK